MGDATDQGRALLTDLAAFSLRLSELKTAVAHLAEQVGHPGARRPSGDRLEAAWATVRSHHEQLQAEFARLAESAEDAMDLADARAARAEAGPVVSLDELKAELGLK